MFAKIYKTIIIDDEQPALKRLERLLKPFADTVQIIDKAKNGTEAVEKINAKKPELIFLDIQMPELNGFEVLTQLDYLPLVIFSTAFDEYALKAFETNSIDYLLKPINSERLDQAIEKLKRINLPVSENIKGNINELLSKIHSEKLKRIHVKVGNKLKIIDLSEIYFFRADNKYVELFTFDKKYLINDPLSKLEEKLHDDFVRVHRSVIINMSHSDELLKISKDSYLIKMKDSKQSCLPVSRSLKSNLKL